MENFFDVALGRKSVRSFDGRPLGGDDRAKLEAYIAELENPFGVPVRFVLLDAKEQGLSSPVLTGETLYVAGLVGEAPNWEAAYGYTFEKLLLYAWSLGVGSVWIGGTMKRENFERAAGRAEGERMPCVSPLGYPSGKRSVKETLMRKGIGADQRKPLDALFFDGDFSTPLQPAGREAELMEAVRWAPSAVNKQPWRILRRDGLWHFFEKRDGGFLHPETGDLQKIDVGIALAHFMLGAEAAGLPAALVLEAPDIVPPSETEYIASVRLEP